MWFLIDYIVGDSYYKVGYDQHNLDRARNQIKLIKDMNKNYKKMIEIVRGSISLSFFSWPAMKAVKDMLMGFYIP